MPGLALAGIGAGVSILSGVFAGNAARRAARSLSTNPNDFDPGSGAFDRLISQQQGRNLGQESQQQARNQGYGYDQGQFEQSSAIRGAGRNAFGKLGLEAREQGQERFAGAAEGIRGNLANEQMGAMERLMAQRVGARQFAIGTANNNRMAKIGLRADAARNTFGPIGQMGGQAFGMGMSQLTSPAAATVAPSGGGVYNPHHNGGISGQPPGGRLNFESSGYDMSRSFGPSSSFGPASPGATGAQYGVPQMPGTNQFSPTRSSFNPTGPYQPNASGAL